MSGRSLVGTVRGAQPCGRCRHSRTRHERRGLGRCTYTIGRPALFVIDGVEELATRCPCPGHVAPKGK